MMNTHKNTEERNHMELTVQLFHDQDESKLELLKETAYEMMHSHEGNYFGICVENE